MGGGVGKGKVGLWCGRSRKREGWVVVWEKGKGRLGCGVGGGVGKGKVGLWCGRRSREREGWVVVWEEE